MTCCAGALIVDEWFMCETVEARAWIWVLIATCQSCGRSKILEKDVRR